MLKPLIVWITSCGKFLKRWEYQTTLLASWEICMQVKKQQLELDMEQWTGSKFGKECVEVVYCHPAYLTYMQRTSCEIPGWIKNWCFWTVVLEKTFESPLDSKEIQLVNPKENQPWIFTGRTDADAEAPVLRPLDEKSWLIGKDPDAEKDWR